MDVLVFFSPLSVFSGTLNATKNCFAKVWNLLIFFAVMFDVSYSTPELANQNAPRGFYPRPGPLPGPVHIYRKRNCHRYPCNDLVFLQCVSPGYVRNCVRQMVSSNVYFAARLVCRNVHSRPQSLRSFWPAAGIESSGSNHFRHAP